MNRKIMSIASVLMAIITLAFFSSCKEEDPVQNPEFNWNGDKVVDGVFNAAAEANQYALEYGIKNPIEGAALTAEADKDWISIVSPKSAEPEMAQGTLTFAVAANEGEAREGRITLKYENMTDQVLTVKQAAAGQGPEDPDKPDNPEGEDFVVTISDETPTSVQVTIVPKDEEATYVMFLATEEQFIEDGLMEDDAAVVAADEAFLIQDGETYGESLEQTFEFYSTTGQFSGPASGLSPATSYVVYCYGAALKDGRLVNTTKVYRTVFSTLELNLEEVDFNFEIGVDGAIVDLTVTAVSYDGYFFFDALENVTDVAEAQTQAVTNWIQLVDFYKMFGYDAAGILNELAVQGTGSYQYEMKPETPYMAYAMGLSEDAMPYSNPDCEPFTTGEIEPSANVITIDVTEIQARQAKVSMTPTNEDPYTAVLYVTSEIAGKTDQEIIDLCLEVGPQSVNGPREELITDLDPETGYSILCFGCVSNTATTALFRKDFTTLEAVEGTSTITVTWSDYYDIEAVAEIDPGFTDYLSSGDFFLPLNVVTDPVDAEVYYYCAYSEETLEEYGVENTDEALTKDLISYGPSQARDDAYILSYGEHNFIVAVVADANGNLSKLWRSEVFVLQKEGASDPQGFLDKYAAPAKMPKVTIPYALEISEPQPVFGVAATVTAVENELVKYQDIDWSKAVSRGNFIMR